MIEPDLPAPFRCDVFSEGEGVRLAPVGELDAAVVERIRETVAELRASGCDRFVLDLGELSFIDSTGLRLVLELHAADIRLELIAGPPAVQKIFALTGTLQTLPFREA